MGSLYFTSAGLADYIHDRGEMLERARGSVRRGQERRRARRSAPALPARRSGARAARPRSAAHDRQLDPAAADMTIKGKAYIVGAYEHPTRKAADKSVAQLHAEVAKGALEDAGLTQGRHRRLLLRRRRARPRAALEHGELPGPASCATSTRPTSAARSYLVHVAHAAQAIAAGKCNVALITLAGRPRSEGSSAAPQLRAAAAPTCPTRRSRCPTAP